MKYQNGFREKGHTKNIVLRFNVNDLCGLLGIKPNINVIGGPKATCNCMILVVDPCFCL